MVLANTTLNNLASVDLFLLIILGWILISYWQKPIDSFCFVTLGLDKDSLLHTLVIALVLTTIFFAYIFIFESGSPNFLSEFGISVSEFPN